MQKGIYFVEGKTVIVARLNNSTIYYDFFDYKRDSHKIDKPIEQITQKEIFGDLESRLWNDDLGRILDLIGAA